MSHLALCWRRFAVTAIALAALLGWSSTAHAQGIGFQGGATVDPGQVFFGTHFETGQLAPGLRFRPGIDGGFGGDYSLASINIEFLYGIPLRSGWTLYQGGGPAIIITRQTFGQLHQTTTHGGTFVTFGFGHESGLFTEFKLGGGSSPNLRFGVGYTVRKRRP